MEKQLDRVIFTKLTSLDGPIGKVLKPDGNGYFDKTKQIPFVVGMAERISIPFSELPGFLKKIDNRMLLIPGIHEDEKVGILSKVEIKKIETGEKSNFSTIVEKLKNQPGLSIVPKELQHFAYPEHGVFVNMDNDTGMGGKKFDAALTEVIPGYENALRVLQPSSSSLVYDKDGNELSGAKNLHGYVGAADGSDIPRFKKALQGRLWLAGHGWIKISRDGRLLARTIVDDVAIGVVQPIFAGGAICEGGLTQKRVEGKLRGSELLDTSKLKSLSADEYITMSGMVDAAKKKHQKEADRIFGEWKQKKAVVYREKGLSDTQINDMLNRASRPGPGQAPTLSGSYILHLDDGREVTVGELIADASKFDGETLADPLEPEEGSGKAKFYANDISRYKKGVPAIHSMLHGGGFYYTLAHDYNSLEQAFLFAMDEELSSKASLRFIKDHWIDWLLDAQLGETDEGDLKAILMKVQGWGVGTKGEINREYSAAKKKRQKKERKEGKDALNEFVMDQPENLKYALLSEQGYVNHNAAASYIRGINRGKTFYRKDSGSMLKYKEQTGLYIPYTGRVYKAWVRKQMNDALGHTTNFTDGTVKSIAEMMLGEEVLAVTGSTSEDYREKILAAHGEWVHFDNGLYNIKEKKFYDDWSEEVMLTYGMGCNFDQDATCERFKEVLLRMFRVESEDAFVIQKMRAALHVMIRRMVHLQVMFNIIGKSRSGKGVLGDIMIRLCGGTDSVAVTTRHALENNQFESAFLTDKSGVFMRDEDPRPMPFSFQKQMTGGDPIRREEKGVQQTGIGARMSGMFVTMANGCCRFLDSSLAPEGRNVPFFLDHQVPAAERIVDLADQITDEELCGIVLWALDMTDKEVENVLLGDSLWSDPDKVRYLKSTRPEASWMFERVVFSKGAKLPVGSNRDITAIDAQSAWADFKSWLGVDTEGVSVKPGRVEPFSNMVSLICEDFFELDVQKIYDKGSGKNKEGRGHYFTNLALISSKAGVSGVSVFDYHERDREADVFLAVTDKWMWGDEDEILI